MTIINDMPNEAYHARPDTLALTPARIPLSPCQTVGAHSCPFPRRTDVTDIDLTAYLDHSELKEIAADEFRQQVRAHLDNDVKVSDFLYEMTQNIVTEALTENVGAGWVDKITQHVKGALKDKDIFFYVFRERDAYTRRPDGPGIPYLKAAVDKHAPRIETRVLHAIDEMDDYRLGELFRDALAKKLGGTE